MEKKPITALTALSLFTGLLGSISIFGAYWKSSWESHWWSFAFLFWAISFSLYFKEKKLVVWNIYSIISLVASIIAVLFAIFSVIQGDYWIITISLLIGSFFFYGISIKKK